MRRRIIIHNEFVRDAAPFRRGQKVYYKGYGDPKRPGVIVDVGEKNGEIVYDVKLDSGEDTDRWGYSNQFSARDGIGTPEEVAYGEGYRAMRSDANPYQDKARQEAWERGKGVAKLKGKMAANYFKGEARGMRFQRLAQKDVGTGTWEVKYTLLPSVAKREGVAPNQGDAFSDAYEARKEFDRLRRSGECSRVSLFDPYGKKSQGDSADAERMYNSSVAHIGVRGAGGPAWCGNNRAGFTFAKERFKELPDEARCKNCQAKMERFAKKDEPAKDGPQPRSYSSEKGWIAKIFSDRGTVVAESPPFISETPAEA